MTDICVTLPLDRGGLVHLGEKGDSYKYNETPMWETSIKPTRLEIGEKVFICTEGYIRGFFRVQEQEWEGGELEEEAKKYDYFWNIYFINHSYRPIIPIKKRGFRGIWYRIGIDGKVRFSFVNVYELLSYHPEDLIHKEYYCEDFITWFESDNFFCADLGEIDREKWFSNVH